MKSSDDEISFLLKKAIALSDLGRKIEAEALYLEVLDLDSDNFHAKNGLETLVSLSIPQWHFDMLADENRNKAFQKAIEEYVNKNSNVLDIGTGSGLLAMMAAKAGAKSVLGCEVNTDIAEVAEKVVAANGYQDRIRIVGRHSDRLKKGADFEEKFDVIIAEVLDTGGLGEGVLPSLRYAINNLAKSNATIIPSGISLKAVLIEAPKLQAVNPIREISGFDLSPFQQFRVSDTYKLINLKREPHKVLSDVFPLRSFDFKKLPKPTEFDAPDIEPLKINCTGEGQLHGVAFWFDMHMGPEDSYSSGPDGELVHWHQAIFFFENPIDVKKGQQINLETLYSDELIRFRLA
ncbi:50S ribosomal protein L11 methyltransferase [Roseivirga sp.]|uniref:50S ribosomal protein L11 methyltransferase n=1 Tax=Roseivirga sp. TaxID=1964215 RepID=UPI003B8D7925